MNAQYGNNSAFEQLYQLNIGRIYSLSLHLTADTNSSYKLTENTFIEAWQKISSMSDDITFASWLVSLTIDIYLTNKEGFLVKDQKNRHYPPTENKAELFIYNLPEKERIIFTLSRIEGYSLESISNLLSISENEVKENVENSLLKIRNEGSEAELDSIPKKIEPDKDLWQNIFEKIHDIKVIQKKEEEELAALEVVEETEEEKEERKKLEEELKREKSEKRKKIIKEKFSLFFKEPKNRIFLGVLGLIIIAVIVVVFLRGSDSWEVLSVNGSPMINGNSFNGAEELKDGDVLRTPNGVSSIITIAKIGKVEVMPGSMLERISDNRFSLKSGNIIVKKENADGYLFVEVPSAVIRDFYTGGDYHLTVDGKGTSTINLSDGWILIDDGSEKSYLFDGHSCLVEKDKGTGIPYSNLSTETFKLSLNEFAFNKSENLNNILSQSGSEDALSLWHLLQRVSESERGKIINTLFALSPPPAGFNQEGLHKLDEDLLMEWLHVIKWRE